jgi:hypothetical protein
MLIPRPCQCSQSNLVTGDLQSSANQTCTATLIMLNKNCTWTAKTHAIPSLHRDNFLAKVSGLCPDASSGSATSLYCRAVSIQAQFANMGTIFTYRDSFVTRIVDPNANVKKHNFTRQPSFKILCNFDCSWIL